MSTNFCSQFLKQPAASFSVNSLLASGMDDQYGDMTVSTTTEPLPTSTASIMEPKPDQPLAELDEVELWSRFNRLTNEMIVTKNGRFVPKIGVSLIHSACLQIVIIYRPRR